MNILSTEQLHAIEARLCLKYNLKYEEIRNELVDHIACEIEDKMEQGEQYEEGFTLVFRKWNVRLIADKKGVYQGIPHFIVNQLNKEYRKVALQSGVLTVVFTLLLFLSTHYFQLNNLLLLNSLFFVNAIGVLIIQRSLPSLGDYRYDFLKAKSKVVLLKSSLALAGIYLFYTVWDVVNFTFGVLLIFYFVFSTFLLLRFRVYCNNRQFKIAK
ncbi:hypothetical protein [Myroides sp. DW712]|uniref:hypothetical protein n=1 Tax=Myroides sp. DW712 TaxID=3389800 RepID=UPI003979EA76